VHQFCRVGRYAFIGGYSVVTKDALPYARTVGNRARIFGDEHDRPHSPRLSTDVITR
jgi:acyl-[acyl carrier protein]--UDP-N-acetylglucosamine O-acyltransferase